MELICSTELWRSSLGKTDGDTATIRFVELLRSSFTSFRDHAIEFAKALPQDLRQLTIHDERHTDALWEVFDVVFPVEMIANPLEAYVLGGAFLVHDLGHALCMYPGGLAQLKETPAWRRASQIAVRTGASEQSILENAIRLNHANHARFLAMEEFGKGLYLIDDAELRNHVGPTIGLVAYSHWWEHKKLNESLDLEVLGAVPKPDCPISWTINPRKLGYVLRVCDACQIDGRRAPLFAESLRKPKGVSSNHWGAQRFLTKPFADAGEIRFKSSRPFGVERINDWWTAYDLARTAATELNEADVYFSQQPIQPKVSRVAGASSPGSFARFLSAEGWNPVETRPTISAVTDVIQKLGGVELYGTNLLVPLRELIQNARDAVVAKRIMEHRPESWGTITVTLEQGQLTVADNGIGMSEQTITKFLLDFGKSYWQSSECLEELPSLNFEDFVPVGKFGIGFFSVFMLGSQVKVVSRTAQDGQRDTRVLEFNDGLENRPILRAATPIEQLLEPGTSITIKLSSDDIIRRLLRPPREELVTLMQRVSNRLKWSLSDALAWECPASDVDIVVQENGKRSEAVKANDWLEIEPDQLFRRLFLHRDDIEQILQSKRSKYHLDTMELLIASDGRKVGRASLIDNMSALADANGLYGIVTCGPFRSSIELFTPGILIGSPKSVSRSEAKPLAFQCHQTASKWATKQAKHANASGFFSNLENKHLHAAYVRSLCGDMFDIAIYFNNQKVVSLNDIIQAKLNFSEVFLFACMGEFTGDFDLNNPAHIGVPFGRMTNGKLLKMDDPLNRSNHPQWQSYWYSLWGAAIEAISIAWQCDLTQLLENAQSVSSGGPRPKPAVFRRL